MLLLLTGADVGPGIVADVLDRVGEPFFTTKGPDRGMGLGVFLARTVVEGLGGRFAIESSSGSGTVVSMWIPSHPVTNGRPIRGAAASDPVVEVRVSSR